MKIIAILRERFDPETVRVSRTRGALDTRRARKFINPSDKNGLEEALCLKESPKAEVVALSFGSPESEDALREAMAMGADEAVLISGESPDESLEALVLSRAIGELGEFDLVIIGHRVAGYGASQVGPRLAEILGVPQITRALEVEIADGKARAKSRRSDGYALLEVPLPALLTVDSGANKPRYPSLPAIISAYRERKVTTWTVADLGLDQATLSERDGITEVRETYTAEEREKGERITGDAAQAVRILPERLRWRGF
ncbi:MAG: electron transfer flavoprotein subunit beta/FixA family protein [Anaerolineae bacterium]